MNPLEVLRHHVTGAIERGEAVAIEERRGHVFLVRLETYYGTYGTIISTYRIQAQSDSEARHKVIEGAEKNKQRVRTIVSCERMV